MVPAMFTSFWASSTTGVFAAFRRNRNVRLAATVMEVQLKMPLGGKSSVVSATVMLIAP